MKEYKEMMDTKEAAEFLGVSERSLRNARMGYGSIAPPFIRLGKRSIRYRRSDLVKFIENRAVGSEE